MPGSMRRPRLTQRYLRALSRLRLGPGTVRGKAVARTVRLLSEARDLPGPADTTAAIPPVEKATVRRVVGHNVWVWYRVAGDEIVLVTLTTEPPVPILEDE